MAQIPLLTQTMAYLREFQNTVHTLKYKQADLNNTSSLAYGYSVDKNGYMGSDFNEDLQGLPLKILKYINLL